MNILDAAQSRYTTKAYDATKTIPAEVIGRLLEILRLSPSSVNLQPWHFIVADNTTAKEKLSVGFTGSYAYNLPKVKQASHVIVLCTRNDISDNYLDTLIAQDEKAGRFKNAEAKEGQRNSRKMYVDIHKNTLKDLKLWSEKQTYIALGTLLLAAGAEGVDATPMEGFDNKILDTALGLTERGLSSTVVVSLGYHSQEDFNATLPKSRLDTQLVIENI